MNSDATLIVDGKVTPELRLSTDRGAFIANVVPGSRAEAAGIRLGDVILEINRQTIKSAGEFTTKYNKAKKLLLLIFREGSARYLLLEK